MRGKTPEWFCFCVSEPGGCNPDAKRLYDEILSGYNKLVRPVKNVTDPVTVKVKLKLSQLIDVVRRLFIYIYINGCMMSVCVSVTCQECHAPQMLVPSQTEQNTQRSPWRKTPQKFSILVFHISTFEHSDVYTNFCVSTTHIRSVRQVGCICAPC